MNSNYLGMLLVMTTIINSREQSVVIEPFQEARDMITVEEILSDNYEFLTYEAQGYQEGTTVRYIKSSKYTTYVLRVDDKTVGFINYVVTEPPFIFSFFMEKRGLIHLMGVDSSYQSCGYGRMLLRYALQELQNEYLSEAFLSVNRKNKKARAFYEAEGFVCAYPEVISEYFSNLIYEVELKTQ